ncbi:ATP-grasp domain-containing protein [Daejeonella lutea]|uniref:Uncharacterized protein n=1 Tax=Daejeonella lutea TaxID=572036 RepID=A0A1T5AFF7_9SPHI|nr:hypothetical protein [Daejeonella lutea]SKB33559.1 hypothetical protein SAMN05661099_0654 [Daejeonella lutea]
MPVLITAGLSPESYRLERILGEARTEKRETRSGERDAQPVVFADVSELPQLPGKTSLVIPHYDSPSFVHETLKACLDLGITKVYPLRIGEIRELAKARDLFDEYQIRLMIPSNEWLDKKANKVAQKAGEISVLDGGMLVAGVAVGNDMQLKNETGVFSRATKEQKTEYSLYLVNDAGI